MYGCISFDRKTPSLLIPFPISTARSHVREVGLLEIRHFCAPATMKKTRFPFSLWIYLPCSTAVFRTGIFWESVETSSGVSMTSYSGFEVTRKFNRHVFPRNLFVQLYTVFWHVLAFLFVHDDGWTFVPYLLIIWLSRMCVTCMSFVMLPVPNSRWGAWHFCVFPLVRKRSEASTYHDTPSLSWKNALIWITHLWVQHETSLYAPTK